jgi:hypothetical protein
LAFVIEQHMIVLESFPASETPQQAGRLTSHHDGRAGDDVDRICGHDGVFAFRAVPGRGARISRTSVSAL